MAQTFGDRANVHALATRGGWTASGEWIPVPYVDERAAEELLRHIASKAETQEDRGELSAWRQREARCLVCAPVCSRRDGLATQVDVGPDDGLKHESSVHCDALVSVPKALLSDFVGSLDPERQRSLDRAVGIALGLV